VAEAAGARLLAPSPSTPAAPDGARAQGPRRTVIDSRQAGPGDLFVGLPGRRTDGGVHVVQALSRGAWGVLARPHHLRAMGDADGRAVRLGAEDPLAALQALARAWRRELAAAVIAITGSTGKTSTKDILAALLAPHRATFSSPQNFNTEIGLPLALLHAPAATEILVLELAMRGRGQISELVAIAEPEVGVIVNVGPVHLELLDTVENVAAAKAELIAGLEPGSTIVSPAHEPLLEPHHRDDLHTVTFGPGGDVTLVHQGPDGVTIDAGAQRLELAPSFSEAHNLNNLLAAVAAALAVGVIPRGPVAVAFSALRGQRLTLDSGIVIVNDCYNANPMSMRAALDDLAVSATGRRVAVLGDMLELGADEQRFHAEAGVHARRRGVELLLTVGPRARAMAAAFCPDGHPRPAAGVRVHSVEDAAAAAAALPALLTPGDTVLIKGSRGVGLERVAQTLTDSDLTAPGAGD